MTAYNDEGNISARRNLVSMNNELIKSEPIDKKAITLTPEQLTEFKKVIKIGIYKELHRKGLLTDMQLKRLIAIQNI